MYGKREISGLYGNIGPACRTFYGHRREQTERTAAGGGRARGWFRGASRSPRRLFNEELALRQLELSRTPPTKRLKLDGMCRRVRRSIGRSLHRLKRILLPARLSERELSPPTLDNAFAGFFCLRMPHLQACRRWPGAAHRRPADRPPPESQTV